MGNYSLICNKDFNALSLHDSAQNQSRTLWHFGIYFPQFIKHSDRKQYFITQLFLAKPL